MRDHFQILKIRWRAQGHGSSAACIYYHFKNDTTGERGFISSIKLGEIRTWDNVVKQGRCNILRITRLGSPTKTKDNEISNGRNCRTIEIKPISSC